MFLSARDGRCRARRARFSSAASLRSINTMSHSFAPPLPLLASSVRNAREAASLVELDVLAVRHEVIHDHLLACCAHERRLEALHSRALAAADPQLLAVAALCATALATVRRDIGLLVAEADEVLKGVAEKEGTIKRYAESNEALAAELAEEGGAHSLAAAKERLWLIEESLVHRMGSTLSSLAGRIEQASSVDAAAAQQERGVVV